MYFENPMVSEPIVEPEPITHDVFGDPIYEGFYIWEFHDGDIVFEPNLYIYIQKYLNAKRTEIWMTNKWQEGVIDDGWIFDDYVVSDEDLEAFLESEYGAVQKRAGEE